MNTSQEKILNYLLFFLLSLTGLASLLLVKNNYLYIFILIFLLLYWQRLRMKQVLANYFSYPPSFALFLIFAMVGVLLFQVFSGSPRFYQRPILTLIISLVFYLPYFFLWHKIFLRGKVSLLGTFFLAGLGGVLIFGVLSGKLTNTIFTAPTLVGGLLYVLLKAAGILTVVGALTAFPWLFFAEREMIPLLKDEETKNNSGFGLIEILLGVSLFLTALTLVGTARQRQNIAQQKLAQMEKDRRATKESQTREESPQPASAKDEVKQPKAQTGGDFSGQEMVNPATCQAVPSLAGCEIYYDPSIYYDPYSDPNSPEYQAQLQEQWYASQQDPSQLFFNDPVQLWSQDPFTYQMLEGIYNFQPIPGLPF